jgi:biopolymer transport protein ExbD
MRLPPLSDEFPEIPVVPLIDVMFTLLTFFIVATLFIEKTRAIDLNLPKASTTISVDQKKTEQVDISVDRNGKFYFDKAQVSPAELLTRARALPDDTLIILAGDEKTQYQDIVKALDIVREAGKSSRIALAATAIDLKGQ